MPILKKKIQLAIASRIMKENKAKSSSLPKELQLIHSSHSSQSTISSSSSQVLSSPEGRHTKKRNRVPGTPQTPETSRETKNIVKNYGRAICSFAASELARPYLLELMGDDQVSLYEFGCYVHKMKSQIDGLFHFRSLLLEEEGDDRVTAIYKRLFKDISEVFIKYFSVNWIFHSKVQYKQAHLKFRFKMLRRIQQPELFTYLRNPKNGLKKKQSFRN